MSGDSWCCDGLPQQRLFEAGAYLGSSLNWLPISTIDRHRSHFESSTPRFTAIMRVPNRFASIASLRAIAGFDSWDYRSIPCTSALLLRLCLEGTHLKQTYITRYTEVEAVDWAEIERGQRVSTAPPAPASSDSPSSPFSREWRLRAVLAGSVVLGWAASLGLGGESCLLQACPSMTRWIALRVWVETLAMLRFSQCSLSGW
jgi:hypothetical protein